MSGSDSSLEEPDDASRLRLALAAAQGRLRLLSAHTSGIIFELNAQGRFVRVWASDPSLLARPEPELIGRTVSEAIGPELGAVHDNAVREALPSGRGNEYEYELAVPGGTLHFAASSVVVPADTDSTERAVIVWIRDITEQVRTRAKLLQHERLAALGRLAAGVAHEINNPLAYVLYNIESLTEDLPKVEAAVAQVHSVLQNRVGAEVSEAAFGNAAAILTPSALHDLTERAEEALGGTEPIRSISQAIGTFSRVERSQSSSVDLNYAVECAITMAHTDIKLLAQLTIDLGEIPPVQATIGKLSQVFLNLLINATHAFDASKVEHNRLTVRTWCEGNDVLAEVRDTGQGMSKEQLSRIFEPFYTTKGVGMGSGLGLSICRNILTEFGGDIRAESEPGRGSRFIIRLPADLGEGKQPAETAVAEPARSTLRGRLLVVDDEPAIRALMVRLLGQQHDIVTAESGKEAQLLLEHDSAFDVILCDLMMPGMTGMDLHEWLVAENGKLAARVVFITGGAFTPKSTEYLASTDILTLEKPYQPATLRQLVAERVLAARSKN